MIAGAILVGLYLVPVVAMLILRLSLWGLVGVMEGEAGLYLIMLFYALVLLAPLWFIGIALLGTGRSKQRGRVKGSIAAWILAVGGLPASAVLIAAAIRALCGDASCRAPFYSALTIAFVGIAVLTPIVVASVAWLIWGRPRTA